MAFDAASLVANINTYMNSYFAFWKRIPKFSFSDSTYLKSTSESVRLRIEGNELYKKRECDQALQLYTRSIASATVDSEELALAYGNRSAVLFVLEKYKLCLLDIKRALEGKYPENRRDRLRDREVRCLENLQNENEIQVASQTEGKETKMYVEDTENMEAWRNACNFGNPLLPNTSTKIKLECDEKWGRYMMATKDIQPGEFLSTEEFFAMMLDEEQMLSHCSYCFSKCEALIPCTSCSQVMYCSEYCRTHAENLYHRIECKILIGPEVAGKMLQILEMSPQAYNTTDEYIGKMALILRLSIQALLRGTEQGFQLENLMKKLTPEDIFQEKTDPSNKLYKNDYLCALRMCRSFADFMELSGYGSSIAIAVKIIMELKQLSFFENDGCPKELLSQMDRLNDAESFTAMLFLNHYFTIRISVLGICQVINEKIIPFPTETVLGYGICRLHNLINHSCNPNAAMLTRKRTNVIFAVKPIKEGEQVFISYGVKFWNCHFENRRRKLFNLGFDCGCEACSNKWPLARDLVEHETEFTKKDKDELFENLQSLAPYVLTSYNAGRNVNWHDVEEMTGKEVPLRMTLLLRIFAAHIEWLNNYVKSPNIDVIQCEELFRQTVTSFYSNYVEKLCFGTELYEQFMSQVFHPFLPRESND